MQHAVVILDFDPRQVKPVLNNLSTIIEWYLKHNGIEVEIVTGIQEVVEAIESEEHPSLEKVQRSRKSTVSIVAGGSIIILVLLLVFDVFNLFTKDRFKEIRDPDGRISIAVMPFENLTGDSTLNFWQNGISEFLINDLGNSEELSVLSSRVISDVLETSGQVKALSVSPAVAREVARKIQAGTLITGNFMGSGDRVSIMVNLVNTGSGELIWTSRVDGALISSQYMQLPDSLSGMVCNFLEIKALELAQEMMNRYPDRWIWIQLKGVALHKLGRNSEAIQLLREAKCPYYNQWLSDDIREVERILARADGTRIETE